MRRNNFHFVHFFTDNWIFFVVNFAESDTNSTLLSSSEAAEVEEEKRKRFFNRSDSTALGMDSLTIIW